jgi:hypothetical protein
MPFEQSRKIKKSIFDIKFNLENLFGFIKWRLLPQKR